MLFKHYLVQQNDIRHCPTVDCKNAGFIKICEITGRIVCNDKFLCTQCQTSWSDPLQINKTGNFLIDRTNDFISDLTLFRHNFMFLMSVEPCPNCNVYIEKNSGCDKMTCQKCKYEFCWACLGSFTSYVHENDWICPIVKSLRYSINILLVLSVLLKFQIFSTILYYFYCFTMTKLTLFSFWSIISNAKSFF